MRILTNVLTEADLRPETRAALAALRAAHPLVQERRGVDDVREKAPNDIVTLTDVLVQNVLQQVLREHQPDIAFLGEEGTPTVLQDTRRVWLVDPICGTTNYAAALPLFATNVALVEDGQIVAAAVANGGTGELYGAERGRGAWLVESAGLRRLHVAEGYRLVSVDPDNRGSEGIADFPTAFAIEALAGHRWDVRALSSTIALVYMASGRLAGAVYAPLGAALHFAAGALLASEAGAIVTDHTGADWTIRSPILVAAATKDLHTELQTVAAQVYARITTEPKSAPVSVRKAR
ncbi:MAG: inositol monophosphatase family protein [Chloroflexota bacterium]